MFFNKLFLKKQYFRQKYIVRKVALFCNFANFFAWLVESNWILIYDSTFSLLKHVVLVEAYIEKSSLKHICHWKKVDLMGPLRKSWKLQGILTAL